MNKPIIGKIEKLVLSACKKKTNYYGMDACKYHLIPVVKNAKILAKKLKADEEIIEIAAWFHDYSCIVNKKFYPEHHFHSSRLAENFLIKEKYPKNRIEHIKSCIFTHRASKKIKKESLEAKILASADAMAHLEYINDLFHLAFTTHKLGTEKGTKFVYKKINQSWKKMMPEAKKMMRKRYEAIRTILDGLQEN